MSCIFVFARLNKLKPIDNAFDCMTAVIEERHALAQENKQIALAKR
jgi:hypothetical protein